MTKSKPSEKRRALERARLIVIERRLDELETLLATHPGRNGKWKEMVAERATLMRVRRQVLARKKSRR